MSIHCQYCGKALTTGDEHNRCFPDCTKSKRISKQNENVVTLINRPAFDDVLKERDQLRAENERLKAIIEFAIRWCDDFTFDYSVKVLQQTLEQMLNEVTK